MFPPPLGDPAFGDQHRVSELLAPRQRVSEWRDLRDRHAPLVES
jgi:hypothetical protein